MQYLKENGVLIGKGEMYMLEGICMEEAGLHSFEEGKTEAASWGRPEVVGRRERGGWVL